MGFGLFRKGIEININGLENVTIGDLKEVFKANEMRMVDAVPFMKKFGKKNKLTDGEVLNAFRLSIRLFET